MAKRVPPFKIPKSDKQKQFCKEYRKDRNATAAALRAGYAKASAHTTGWDLLQIPVITAYIARLDEEESERANISREDIINLAREIITADPTDYFEKDEKGITHIRVTKLSPNRRAVQEIKVEDYYDQEGNHTQKTILKLRDPMSAAERVAKLLGMDTPPPPEKRDYTFRIVKGEEKKDDE